MEPMFEKLNEVAEWARGRLRTGTEPPWHYYRLMQLLDAVNGLQSDAPVRTEDLPQFAEHSESVRQPTERIVRLDSFRLRPAQTPAPPQT